MSNNIRPANLTDVKGIKALYFDIVERYPDNLSPFSNEITDEFILDGLTNSLERGAAIVMENEKKEIIAYFKGYTSKNIRKAHILDNMTIMIRSDYNNSISAYRFFQSMFEMLSKKMYYLKCARSVPHAINDKVLKMSKRLGMKQVGLHEKAIMCKDGSFADEVTLVWENPNFSYSSLFAYQKYLLSRYSENDTLPFDNNVNPVEYNFIKNSYSKGSAVQNNLS